MTGFAQSNLWNRSAMSTTTRGKKRRGRESLIAKSQYARVAFRSLRSSNFNRQAISIGIRLLEHKKKEPGNPVGGASATFHYTAALARPLVLSDCQGYCAWNRVASEISQIISPCIHLLYSSLISSFCLICRWLLSHIRLCFTLLGNNRQIT